MKDLHSQKKLEEMRKRLYERGKPQTKPRRHQLTDVAHDVSKEWDAGSKPRPETTDLRQSYSEANLAEAEAPHSVLKYTSE